MEPLERMIRIVAPVGAQSLGQLSQTRLVADQIHSGQNAALPSANATPAATGAQPSGQAKATR
jgi:hypothetical protein